jgi:hypothetical protein
MEMMMFGGDVRRDTQQDEEERTWHSRSFGRRKREHRWQEGVHGEAAALGTTVDFYSCFVPVVSFDFLLFEQQ